MGRVSGPRRRVACVELGRVLVYKPKPQAFTPVTPRVLCLAGAKRRPYCCLRPFCRLLGVCATVGVDLVLRQLCGVGSPVQYSRRSIIIMAQWLDRSPSSFA